ncbi:MAG: preprotein translocase subunit YajC [Filifactoraceae bacterium]
MATPQLMSYAMPILLLAVFYFMLIRPQKKRDQQLKEMRSSLKSGDHVTTIGGIHGRITRVTENTVTIVTSEEKTKLVFEKWAIGKVVLPEDVKSRQDESKKGIEQQDNAVEDVKETDGDVEPTSESNSN